MRKVMYILSSFVVIILFIMSYKQEVDAAYYESEDNGSFSSADLITVNNDVNGTNVSENDDDYYKFNAPSNGYITISMTHTKNEGFHRIELFDNNQDEFFRTDLDRDVAKFTSQKVAVKKGINYILITTYYNNSSYSFSVNFSASAYWETEFNDKIDQADSITVNTTYNGTNVSENDGDYYKFNAPSNGYITISMTHTKNEGFHRIELFDNNQDEFFRTDLDRDVAKFTSQKVAVKKGINYILITTYYNNSSYSFSVNFSTSAYWETEFNDKIDQADSITVNTTYNGTNVSENDDDYYKFNAPSNGYITISMTHTKNEGFHRIELFDNNQDKFFQTDLDRDVARFTSQKVAVKKGINYILITTYYNNDSYSFSVNTVVPTYKISYQLNGGTNNKSNPSTYKKSSSTISLRNPSRKKYLFAGWYSNAGLTTKSSTVQAGSTGNKTFYAKWSKVYVPKGAKPSAKRTKTKLKVSYKAIKNVKGYQIQIATNKKFTKGKKTITTNKRTYTFKKIKKKSKYYIRVRGYKLDSTGSKVPGAWSAIRMVK